MNDYIKKYRVSHPDYAKRQAERYRIYKKRRYNEDVVYRDKVKAYNWALNTKTRACIICGEKLPKWCKKYCYVCKIEAYKKQHLIAVKKYNERKSK